MKHMKTTHIPIPQNEATQRQVRAIWALEKIKSEFNAMTDEQKQCFMDYYENVFI